MAKTKISEYDSTAANNTDVDGINIAESCPPSGINNAIREVMAHLKDLQSGVSGDTIPVASGGTGSGTASGARTNLGLGTVSTLNSIATANIDADAINGTKIADDSIDSEHYVDGSIDTAHIADDAVTSAKIAENAVDATAINVSGNGTSGQLLSSDGDGSMTWVNAVSGLGSGQSWGEYKTSRAFGTTYTNTTGRPIFISVSGEGAPNHGWFSLYVDGVKVGQNGLNSVASAGMHPSVQTVVPAGSTYYAVNELGCTLVGWAELR